MSAGTVSLAATSPVVKGHSWQRGITAPPGTSSKIRCWPVAFRVKHFAGHAVPSPSELYAAIWPGYLISDSVSALKYSLELPFDLWLGFFTPFYNSIVLQLVPHIAALTALQLLLAAAVFSYASDTILAVTGDNDRLSMLAPDVSEGSYV